jgi:hypothetical protein
MEILTGCVMPNRKHCRIAAIAIAAMVAMAVLTYSREELPTRIAADDARAPRPQGDNVGTSQSVPAPEIQTSASAATTATPDVRGLPVQVRVHAPAVAAVGDTLESRVQVEAPGGVRRLQFAIDYDRKRLKLVELSEGDFARRGPAAEFSTDEPSEGNVQVLLVVRDDRWVAGEGSAIVLRFEAIGAGTTSIAARDFNVMDSGARRSPVAVLHDSTIAIR